jgi:predicted alpha/beta hydrolase
MIIEKEISLNSADNVKIALWKIFDNEVEKISDIYLTHGAFSDKSVCLRISKYLASLGYVCWVMEWRNHGESAKSNLPYNLETIAKYDMAIAFEYLFTTRQVVDLHCITHSGGGICLTMFLVKNQHYIPRIKTISLFSCQAFGVSFSWSQHLKLLLYKYLNYLMRRLPGRLLKLGPHDEPYFTMKQWFDWNIYRNFIGEGGFDYLSKMNLITTPVLSICSAGDTFIAPRKGCWEFINAFENKQNRFSFYSKEDGNVENYGHGRIMCSRNASIEVWPEVVSWIEEGAGL